MAREHEPLANAPREEGPDSRRGRHRWLGGARTERAGVEEATPAPARRRSWRARETGMTAVNAAGTGVLALARLVMSVATLIALLIALAVLLRMLTQTVATRSSKESTKVPISSPAPSLAS